jgi:hypothetical protein
MNLFGGTIYIPNTFQVYCSLIIDLLQLIINLENDYLTKKISEDEKEILVKKIKSNLELIGYFLEDKKNEDYINTEFPIDINKNIVPFENLTTIDNYVNPLVVFVNNFKLNWIKYDLITTWEKNGGNYDNLYGSVTVLKKDIIIFINELEKDLSLIDKNIIKKYIGTLYTSIEDNNLRLKLNTFQVYSVIKNNMDNSNKNKIFKIRESDFIKLDKYYKLGINLELLGKEEINRIYNTYERYYENILPDSELTPVIINKYIEFLELQGDQEDIEKKIKYINTRYYSYIFNKFLANKNYKNFRYDIIACYNILKTVNYNFKKEQSDKVKTLNVKLNFEGKIPYQFNPDDYFPLFYYDELCKLKNDILLNKDNLCGIIKKIYPLYDISYDLFCKIESNGQKKYLDKETINKTINFYCVVFLIVGIINFQLKKYNQDYMIILKGGKALQLILSGMGFKDSINYKSNDIDLIISPVEGKKYFDKKCKYLATVICLLIQWILNPTKNMYNKNYYVSYKPADRSDPYPYIIKLSHKIQNSNDNPDSTYTAIADLDFNEIVEKKFYSNLIFDNQNSNSIFGNLLFIYQNLNNFLLEKIYYVNVNSKIVNNNSKLNLQKKTILDKNNLLLIEREEKNKLIKKIISKINESNSLIKKYKKIIYDNVIRLRKLEPDMKQIYFEIEQYKQYEYQQHQHQQSIQPEYKEHYDRLVQNYNYLNDKFKNFNENNMDLNNKIDILVIDIKKNDDERKELIDIVMRLGSELENNTKILEIIKKDISKIFSDENNAKRFIKKFSNQIKYISGFIIKKNESETKTNTESTLLDKQKEYVIKLIKDNNTMLEFDDETIQNIIKFIFSEDI